MSSSIESQSIPSLSIFSQHESFLSANTQWTSENLEKLDEGHERFRSDGKQTNTGKRMGRPEIVWTPATLRKLTRLYLLTDLEVEEIIDVLRTAEFQPSKRHVQEKLKLLLQPQPNTIRARGDTKVLCKLFLECKNVQKARRLRKRRHRHKVETKCSDEGNNPVANSIRNGSGFGLSKEESSASDDFYDGSNFLFTQVDALDDDESFLGDLGSFMLEEQNEYGLALASTPKLDLPSTEWVIADSKDPVPHFDWHLADFGMQPAFSETADTQLFHNTNISSIYDLGDDPPDIGFGADFGSSPMMPLLRNDQISESRIDEGCVISTHVEQATGSRYHPPTVDPTHVQRNIESGADSDQETDAVGLSLWEVAPPVLSFERPPKTKFSSLKEPLLEQWDLNSGVKRRRESKHSQSSSRLSTILSRMSLSSTSSVPDSHWSSPLCDDSAASSLINAYSISLPGTFPKYCWQHITQNRLQRCNHWYDLQKCRVESDIKNGMTYRCIREDVLRRIVDRTVQESDIHQTDTFGNSTLHIATTLLAPPNYLLSLVKLGAQVNNVNNAGQTFLHLIEPEVLIYLDDFCELLELLKTLQFNFAQHDHLGQSPLHLLIRPSIHSDILRKIITTLFSLSIHSEFSTARDCFGFTVMGQINLQQNDESSGIDLDQAILSLACETTRPIIDPKNLQAPSSREAEIALKEKEERFSRNYENHPSITTVGDLVKYEQHVDYWRTILATKHSPWFEDSQGKNGLHCLAEADLVSTEMPLPSQLLQELNSLKIMKHDAMSTREAYVSLLLNIGVDPNNYDKNGNTVLMAFVIHDRETESEESTTEILNMLFNAGADINRRDRQGQTALHLAVKLGRRAATKALLVAGANIHARTSSGLGVLELGHQWSTEYKQSGTSYSQILLCMSLAANFGSVSQPSILDEWASPGWRIPAQAQKEPKGLKLVKKFIIKRAQKRRRLRF